MSTGKEMIDTHVIMKFGQTVILSALLDNTDSMYIDKTPILGDIPVINTLFRQKITSKTKNTVYVFLTPRPNILSAFRVSDEFLELKRKNLNTFIKNILDTTHIDETVKILAIWDKQENILDTHYEILAEKYLLEQDETHRLYKTH